jgi:hypothetical protein
MQKFSQIQNGKASTFWTDSKIPILAHDPRLDRLLRQAGRAFAETLAPSTWGIHPLDPKRHGMPLLDLAIESLANKIRCNDN